MPLSRPLNERFIPGGKAPDETQKVGAGAPAAVYWKFITVPTLATVAGGPSVIDGGYGVGFTLMVRFCVALGLTPLLAVTAIVKGDPVMLVGVPLITPVDEFKFKPAGNVPLEILQA